MADFENLAEINENFDTIKTLLNSIRAQGILNTSDVDKLLSGINLKLEKLNTEEDIDLIKIFLSELKQNLEERHGLLISKFAAIESLFGNLLKNSSEMLKSSEVKELFDIVATNLSVFSREVVSQKESLTDISLRLDAIRSDDSQKKDIIKNITILKSDIERLSNGFDSIVISLNDNFKTIVKTITSLDKTEYFENFSDVLKNIEMSSNTVLSALQMLDKKTEQVESILKDVATKDDMAGAAQKIFELTAQSHELTATVSDLNNKYIKFESLSEKIDASVDIIAGIKSILEASDDSRTQRILSELMVLQDKIINVSSEEKFEELKKELEIIFKFLQERIDSIGSRSVLVFEEVQKLGAKIQALDIQQNLDLLKKEINETSSELSQEMNQKTQSIISFNEVGIERVVNEITDNVESLSGKIAQVQNDIGIICEKSFNTVFEKVADVKSLLAQVEENGVSANNAIFSSITDRLSLFETSLRDSLELQEKTVLNSSAQLVDHIENIKNISNVLDYKLDTSVVEAANVKREFSELKSSVENVLALDFTNVVKDLRIDLYAVKQDLTNSFDNSSSELTERFTTDLYGKYELLVSKIDSVEEELRNTQLNSLAGLRTVLDNISASLMDVISYVSERKNPAVDLENAKFDEIINLVNDNNISYVENVRDIVDVIRVQVETNLKTIEEENINNFDNLKRVVSENSTDLRNEIKYSYSKLLEIQDSYNEIPALLNLTREDGANKFAEVLASTDSLKTEIELKIDTLKNSLSDKISDFKTEFTCENADKISEIKFSIESLYNKNSQDIEAIVVELREAIKNLSVDEINGRVAALSKITDNFSTLKELLYSFQDKNFEVLNDKVKIIIEDLDATKEIIHNLDENVDGDMSRQLSIIESNFESLVSQLTILFEKSEITMADKIEEEFAKTSEQLQEIMAQKIENYKETIENVFAELKTKTLEQSDYIRERISNLHETLKEIWDEQSKDNLEQLANLTLDLKKLLDENVEVTKADLSEMRQQLNKVSESIELKNNNLSASLNVQLDDIAKYINAMLEAQAQDNEERQTELNGLMSNVDIAINNCRGEFVKTGIEVNDKLSDIVTNLSSSIGDCKADLVEIKTDLSDKIDNLKSLATDSVKEELLVIDAYVNNINQQLELQKNNVISCKDIILKSLKAELVSITSSVEKETDIIIGEIIEQFDLLKKSKDDEIVTIVSRIEEVVNANIYNNIEDLKSYLDIKTDDSVLNTKFDNFKIEVSSAMQSVLDGMGRLLESQAFVTSMSDFKLANEVLINSVVENLNSKLEDFVNTNISELASLVENNNKKFDEKLILFDKKFTEILVEKFEEIKLIGNSYNTSSEKLSASISEIISEFNFVKQNINNEVDKLSQLVKNSVVATNSAISMLSDSFAILKEQIINNASDDSFKKSISKQVSDIENLVNEQMDYLENIENVCATNLPDVAEINTLLKYSVLNSLDDIRGKIEKVNQDESLVDELMQLKSDIITQFLNVFNQISFVVEQEEIIDYIQEKHDELITILSHIVTSANNIDDINEKITFVDNKIDTLRDDLDLINEKITAIISSEGDIDYVYSLHDLEADIANLRLVLNEMKENGGDFDELIASTNDIYKLVETIKTDLPSKQNYEDMAEDIVSISTRTNKLILASDESYKNLQDNLQDFKLVINDLDERTRNFAREAGLDKIDLKLNALNNMVQNGAKTNQVFNQVFEYLAEWVDNASSQINTISNKVETLDDIGQIKAMLMDIKEGAEDNSETVELVEALGAVFDKQTKRISNLETKLDKIIVETTIINKNNKLDLTPFESTLNSFLVAVDEKMSAQQDKINSLEAKLESVINAANNKETLQLTKKVGGMDKQIAKLNKSIEKIASYVVEK